MATCSSIGLRTLALVTVIFMLLTIIAFHGKGDAYKNTDSSQIHPAEDGAKGELGMELYPTGSRLPDCSHACGPCFPCKRVTVSFKCSNSESCPIVYKCMCKGKYYHVPSN